MSDLISNNIAFSKDTINVVYSIKIPYSYYGPNINKKINEKIRLTYLFKANDWYYIENIESIENKELPLIDLNTNELKLTLKTNIVYVKIGELIDMYLYNIDNKIFAESRYVLAKINTNGMLINIQNNKINITYENKNYNLNNKTIVVIKVKKILNSTGVSKITVEGDIIFKE